MRLILMMATLGLGAATACTPMAPGMAQTEGGRACFFVDQVRSFSSPDGRTVYEGNLLLDEPFAEARLTDDDGATYTIVYGDDDGNYYTR